MKKVLIVLAALTMTAMAGAAAAETVTSSCDWAGCTYTTGDGWTVYCSSITHSCKVLHRGTVAM